MRNIISSILLLIAFAVSSHAVNRIQITFDYTKGIYKGLTYKQILSQEYDFNKDQPRYEGRFFDELFEAYSGIAYKPDSVDNSEPVVHVVILKVSSKGDILAEIACGDKSTILEGKGGVFGTFLNLFGDGMQSLGRNVALWLNTVCPPAVSNR